MDQDSMVTVQLVVKRTPNKSLGLLIELYRAALRSRLDGTGRSPSFRLSIVAPTYLAVSGIYQEVYASISTTASQDRSSTES